MNLTLKSANNMIETISPHTIKKFEIIEKYIEEWAFKLLQNKSCKKLIYIDCMSNCGVYKTNTNDEVNGSPLRVAKVLSDISCKFPNKSIELYFNDISEEKIKFLEKLLFDYSKIIKINFTNMDASVFLKQISVRELNANSTNYFLLYDPYVASIDWRSLLPYFKKWGEVLINHMVSDTVRAINAVKKDSAKMKYTETYLYDEFDELIPFGSDRDKYEARIKEIITALSYTENRDTYISSFPVFNEKNALLYNLVHWTTNLKGKVLFKKTAWKTFGGKSSNKKVCSYQQYKINIVDNTCVLGTNNDSNCYTIADIASYLQKKYRNNKIPIDIIWDDINMHPVFPSDGYKNEIKKYLKQMYADVEKGGCIIFKDI